MSASDAFESNNAGRTADSGISPAPESVCAPEAETGIQECLPGFESPDPSYAEIFGIDRSCYGYIDFAEFSELFGASLSPKSLKVFCESGLTTLGDISAVTPAQLTALYGLDKKTVKSVEGVLGAVAAVLRSWDCGDESAAALRIAKIRLVTFVMSALENRPLPREKMTEREKECVERALEAAEILGTDLSLRLLNIRNKRSARNIVRMLSELSRVGGLVRDAERTTQEWDGRLRGRRLLPFLQLFCGPETDRLSGEFRSFLSKDVPFERYPELVSSAFRGNIRDVLAFSGDVERFNSWMASVNITELCRDIFKPSSAKGSRNLDMLRLRSTGLTLKETGTHYGLTIESARINERMLLKEIREKISEARYNPFAVISAYLGGKLVLSKEETAAVAGSEYADLLWHCVSRPDTVRPYSLDNEYMHYENKQDRVIFVGCGNAENRDAAAEIEEADKIISEFPDFVLTSDLMDLCDSLAEKHSLPADFLKVAVLKQYKAVGKISCRGKLTVIRMCDYILKEYFKDGYKIGGDDNIRFRKCMTDVFGEKGKTTRCSVEAKIMEYGVLAGRGYYLHRDHVHADRELAEAAFAYVDSSPKTAIEYKEIFNALRGKFEGTVIKNRYILQGVMKMYGCPYKSYRDYVTKSDGTNIADELCAYIRKNGVVSKEDIFRHFPGWEDYNLIFILERCKEIFSIGDGYYMHESRLKTDEETEEEISVFLEEYLGDHPVSVRRILPDFIAAFPEFAAENDIRTRGKLYGILRHFFSDRFRFSQPFISISKPSMTNRSVLLGLFEGRKSVSIDELLNACRQNSVYSGSSTYVSKLFAPEFLRINKSDLMRYECTGLNEDMYKTIRGLIYEAVESNGGYIAVGRIDDFDRYPALSIPWTTFLLESVSALLPEPVKSIKAQSSNPEIPHTIFLDDSFADDDWRSFLLKVLKKRHSEVPFASEAEVLRWLREEKLCFARYPSFVKEESFLGFGGRPPAEPDNF